MISTSLDRDHRQNTYLHIQLTADTRVAIPLYAGGLGSSQSPPLQEVFPLAVDRLTPIPYQPHWMMGLVHQRGHVFWVLDLADFLGFPPLAIDEQIYNHSCVIIQVERQVIGLGVQQVCGILRLNPERAQAATGAVAPHLEPYLQGYFPRSKESLLVLDPAAIIYGASDRLAGSQGFVMNRG